MSILFLDACARPNSRTRSLALHLLNHLSGERETIRLYDEPLRPLDAETLAFRDDCVARGDYRHPMFRYAHALTTAEEIVLAAPYWDLSFPSTVKLFLEQTTVTGLTFSYTEAGQPVGHCRAKHFYYVFTAGGPVPESDHGSAYVKDLVTGLYGVKEFIRFGAENLDILGADVDGILQTAIARISCHFQHL